MPVRHVTLAAALGAIAAFTGCTREQVAGMELKGALDQAYPSSYFSVAFRLGEPSGSHLSLTVDDSSSRTLSDSLLRSRARSLGLFVLDAYESPDDLDSITIFFVRDGEREVLSASYSGFSVTLATGELR